MCALCIMLHNGYISLRFQGVDFGWTVCFSTTYLNQRLLVNSNPRDSYLNEHGLKMRASSQFYTLFYLINSLKICSLLYRVPRNYMLRCVEILFQSLTRTKIINKNPKKTTTNKIKAFHNTSSCAYLQLSAIAHLPRILLYCITDPSNI